MRCWSRPGTLLFPALSLLFAGSTWAAEPKAPDAVIEIRTEKEDNKKKEDRPWLGIRLDAGVPDGASAGLVLRPLPWLRLSGAATSNLAGFGYRGGVEIVPFDSWISPSLSVDLGRYEKVDVRGAVSEFVDDFQDFPEGRLSYTYANAHVGLELGSRWFSFFLRGGYSVIDAEVEVRELGSGLRLSSPVTARILTPTAKLGFTAYLF